MVYIVNAEFCQSGFELSRKRNILFTGITRSRCWVRLFGVGDQMAGICNEVEKTRAQDFMLAFDYPDREQIKRLARVHRDMTDEERKDWEQKIGVVGDVFRAVVDGELPFEALPRDVRRKLVDMSKAEASDEKK